MGIARVFDWSEYMSAPVAMCGNVNCNSTSFHLKTDGYGDNWRKITGTICVHCGHDVNWFEAEKQKEGKEVEDEESR